MVDISPYLICIFGCSDFFESLIIILGTLWISDKLFKLIILYSIKYFTHFLSSEMNDVNSTQSVSFLNWLFFKFIWCCALYQSRYLCLRNGHHIKCEVIIQIICEKLWSFDLTAYLYEQLLVFIFIKISSQSIFTLDIKMVCES